MKKIISALNNLKNPLLCSEEEKRAYVIAKYIFAFVSCLGFLTSSYALADWINEYFPLDSRRIAIFQIISAAILAIGTIGGPIWKIQTFSGNSPAKQLNEKISKVLSCIGFILTFCTFQFISAST